METDRQMLQRTLRQMSESQRSRTGWMLFSVGVLLLILGVWFNHYANFPEIESVTFPSDQAATFVAGDTVNFDRQMRIVDETPTIDPTLEQATVKLTVEVSPFGWVPRGCVLEGSDWCLPFFTFGHLVALAGSQLILGGLMIAVVLGRKLTWALATFSAFVVMFELVLLVGTVSSEWLNLAQGPLNWTEQNDAFPSETTWAWLADGWRFIMLGNDVGISWGTIKDIVSVNYSMAVLAGAIIFAWKIQDWGKPLPELTPGDDPTSPYGRTLVKGAK